MGGWRRAAGRRRTDAPVAMTAGVAGACSTLTGDCFSSDLTSFLPPCRLLLKLSIVRMISFILFFFVRLSSCGEQARA